jgi:hypothetical protein
MKSKTLNILYWTLTIVFALLILFDGIGGVTKQQEGIDVMNHLGYPVYFMVITGVAKLLAAVAIVQNKFRTIKEWAYAGIAFNFLGAFASRAFVGDPVGETIFPLIMTIVLFVIYFTWKRYNQLQPSTTK